MPLKVAFNRCVGLGAKKRLAETQNRHRCVTPATRMSFHVTGLGEMRALEPPTQAARTPRALLRPLVGSGTVPHGAAKRAPVCWHPRAASPCAPYAPRLARRASPPSGPPTPLSRGSSNERRLGRLAGGAARGRPRARRGAWLAAGAVLHMWCARRHLRVAGVVTLSFATDVRRRRRRAMSRLVPVVPAAPARPARVVAPRAVL